jgi:hypothetical protein
MNNGDTMLRQTVIYPMTNNTQNGALNVGFDSFRPDMRLAPCGHDNTDGEHVCASPFSYGLSPEGIYNPCGMRYVWEPHIISISATVRDADGSVSTLATNQLLATAVAYSVWDGNRQPSTATYTALTTSNLQQPWLGFRSGQIGGRELYATNNGEGFYLPRQVLPGDRCSAKYHRVWSLVLSHAIEDDGSSGAWVLDWQWKLRGL